MRLLGLALALLAVVPAAAQAPASWSDRVPTEVEAPPAAADSLENPVGVRVEGGDVFVSDFGDYRVGRFTADGVWAGAYGGTSWLDAFRNVSDMAARGDTVWVADMVAQTVSVFTRGGRLVRRMAVPGNARRLAPTAGGLLALTVSGRSPVAVLDRAGAVLAWTGDTLGGEGLTRMDRGNGALAPTPDGGAVYVPPTGTVAQRIAPDGTVGDGFLLAAHAALPDGRAVAEQDARSASVDGGALWVHVVLAAVDGAAVSALDRYDVATGRYVESLALPSRASDAVVSEGRAFAIDDERLRVFDL